MYDLLENYYVQNPSQVSNIAFWKVIHFLKLGKVDYRTQDNKHYLKCIYQNKMFFYASWIEKEGKLFENIEDCNLTLDELRTLDFFLLNETQYKLLKPDGDFEVSYPLFYKESNKPSCHGYYVDSFDFEHDFEAAADFINKCYNIDSYTAKKVKAFTLDIAFDPELWVWIKQEASNEKAALAIGDFYTPIKEGSLDWVQVSPDFRGQGIGELLVYTLVKRIESKEGTIRVTGMADAFYERCGFEKASKWYIFDKKREDRL